MAKKRSRGQYPKAFRKMAVARRLSGGHLVALSKQLGIHRRRRYKGREPWEPIDDGEAPAESAQERELRVPVAQ